MNGAEQALTADALMDKLKTEAMRAADPRRLATLARLTEACDELLSGEAYKRAKAAKRNPDFFNPNFLRLNSNTVHQFVRLRAHLDGSGTSWTGPVATTIRAEKSLMDYLRLREHEAKRPRSQKSRGPRSGKLEEIVNGLQSITDQAILRQALADGRTWKRQLDILLATLRRIPSIDTQALREGNVMSSVRSETSSPNALSVEEIRALRKMLLRWRDNDQLAEFGLEFRNGRIKMEHAPGLDLIFPEEMVLLARLAGEPGPFEGKEDFAS